MYIFKHNNLALVFQSFSEKIPRKNIDYLALPKKLNLLSFRSYAVESVTVLLWWNTLIPPYA